MPKPKTRRPTLEMWLMTLVLRHSVMVAKSAALGHERHIIRCWLVSHQGEWSRVLRRRLVTAFVKMRLLDVVYIYR